MNINELIIKNILYIYKLNNNTKNKDIIIELFCKTLNIDKNNFDRIEEDSKSIDALQKTSDERSNVFILSSLITLLIYLESYNDKQLLVLKKFTESIGLNNLPLKNFESKINKNDSIKNSITKIKDILTEIKSNKKKSLFKESLYVATQITKEGIDELQALYLCMRLGLNAALDGMPGVGKTQSVLEVSRIFDVPLFTKTCSSRTTESHIISHPVLTEKNGVSITAHANGPLVNAMILPGIFYGDEYNLLKEDVQKRMNSAFDDRRYIDRNDGIIINAKKGFFSIISYNPAKDISVRDLEDSVADRFVHFHYKEWISDLKAYISMKKSRPDDKTLSYNDYGIVLEKRGFSYNGDFFIKDNISGLWVDFFTGREYMRKPDFEYYAHKVKNLNQKDNETIQAVKNLSGKSYNINQLSRVFAKFSELINELSLTGKSPLLSKVGLGNINSSENIELLTIHRTSTRIISAALSHYIYFIEKNWSSYLAQSYAASIIINQMCYGSYRNTTLKDITNYSLINNIAQSFGLHADNKTYNTNFIKENLL